MVHARSVNQVLSQYTTRSMPYTPALSSISFSGPGACKVVQGAVLLQMLCMATGCAESFLYSVLNATAGLLELYRFPAQISFIIWMAAPCLVQTYLRIHDRRDDAFIAEEPEC